MVVPQSKPFRSGKMLNPFDHDSVPENSFSLPGNPTLEQSAALSSLKALITAGDQRLDPMLATIVDAARQLTGATGAALAMWKEGAMVCRARSGDTAPVLGARLSADTGISGECLRTGKVHHCADTENDPLVDVEVCRNLGLRSIAVLPIQGWRGINGILEVFSTQPSAFTEQHIALLQQLAALAERARATQPHGASAAAPKSPPAIETSQSSGLLPASDRVGDVARAFVGNRSRPFVLGGLALVAISLVGLVIWLGWRGADGADSKAHPAIASSSAAGVDTASTHPLDNDPVWKANPGGETLAPSGGKPSAGAPVKFASKVDVLAGKDTHGDRSPSSRSQEEVSLQVGDVAAKAAIPRGDAGPQADSGIDTRSNDLQRNDSHKGDIASTQAPMIAADSTNQSPLDGVLSEKPSLPGLSADVSQGVSGGQVVHQVSPVYPAQARLLRLEGSVLLNATVMEDGTVGDVRVVKGSAVLAQSAVDAVKHWRYKPFELDGKAVKNVVGITIDFKLPPDADSR